VIDPSVFRALNLALVHFDEAYVDVVQAARRVLILAQAHETPTRAPVDAKGSAQPTAFPPAPPHAPISVPAPSGDPVVARVLARREAVAKGYTGFACSNCGGFNMRQSGVCSVCADCGTSAGCS
jgi:hypothetical protein